jgi:predicted transcriptional regulator
MARPSWRHGVQSNDTVYEAIKMMADKDIGALVVLDASKLVGIVTERDYARNVFLKGRASPQTLVGEIMGRDVICVEPDKSIEECMAITSAKRVRHLPVEHQFQLQRTRDKSQPRSLHQVFRGQPDEAAVHQGHDHDIRRVCPPFCEAGTREGHQPRAIDSQAREGTDKR